MFVGLIEVITSHFEMKSDDIFLDFNTIDTRDEQFDEYFHNRRDLGKIIKETAKVVGVQQVTTILIQKLDRAI